MGAARGKSLSEQLADLEDPTPKDFDPEDLDHPGQSSDDDSEGDANQQTGREHYQAVGRGKLRGQNGVELGKEYAGSRVSRDALEESDDDPFRTRTDGETDSDSAEEEDEEESPEETTRTHGPHDTGSEARFNLNHVKVGPLDKYGRDDSTAEDFGSDDERVRGRELLSEKGPHRIEEKSQDEDVSADQNGADVHPRPVPVHKLGVTGVRSRGSAPKHVSSSHFQGIGEFDKIGGRGDEGESAADSEELRGMISEDDEYEEDDGSQRQETAHDDSSHFQGSEDDEGESDEEMDSGSEEDTDDSSDEGAEERKETKAGDEREELRRLMATDQKTIAASLSQAAKADAVKGKAVKQQRAGFDALLNARIKLQKGLGAVNHLAVAENAHTQSTDAVSSAESAALSLWSTLEDLRLSISNVQSTGESKKRKRSPVSSSTSTSSLWQRMTDLESESHAHRRAILDKWSLKVRGSNATTPNARGKLLGSSTGQQNITAVLDAQVASEIGDRSIKRSRKDSEEDSEPIYDDTVFYQSLLRDLVEQRMSSDALTNGLDTLHIQIPSRSVHPVTGMRKDKVKRDVDTRASKGRKMRYHVHEKLQNFMAPEDRGTWTDRARDEFFASLLGKTASGLLREGDDEASAGEQSEEDVEEGGLRLFRS